MKKHIYIYSPSGAVRDKAAFRRGVARLTALGHQVEIDPDALTSWQRFAGDDATRLAAVHRAAASGADVALVSRGGYGMTRLLPDLQYKAIGKAIERGMLFIGISDFTALQCAILAKTGHVTWAGPALCEGFGVGGKSRGEALGKSTAPLVPDEIMEACFDDIAKRLPEFHFGRFDVRFEDFAQVQQGRAFTIVEVNGAGAESTHIWDRSTGLVEAWRALMRQYRWLFEIGAANRARGVKTMPWRDFIAAYRREKALTPLYPPTH